jgi:tripartite-type tricarboxylate transporter receptor subunit TctC
MLAKILCIAALAVGTAFAQPVTKVVVPYGPGGGNDSIARAVAKSWAELSQRTVIVENRPGGNTMVGIDQTLKSDLDGTTVVIANPNVLSTIASTGQEINFEWKRDLVPVAYVGTSLPFVLVVNSDLKVKNIAQLQQLAKTRVLSYASAGVAQPHHIYGELLSQRWQLRMTHIPYKSSAQTLTDILSGQVDIMWGPVHTVRQHIAQGKLVPLAIVGDKPLAEFPGLPTTSQLGMPEYTGLDVNYMFYIPSRTPVQIQAKLKQELSQAYQHSLKNLIERDLVDPRHAIPADLDKFSLSQGNLWHAKTTQALTNNK